MKKVSSSPSSERKTSTSTEKMWFTIAQASMNGRLDQSYKFVTSFSVHLFPILFLLLITYWGTKSLIHPGLYTAHDIWHQVARLYHYSDALGDGQFFPLWIANLAFGYGYPLFIFSYHLPWMIGGPLVLAGVSVPATMKILFGGSYLISGLLFYWTTYRMMKSRLAAIVGATLYLVAPPHFLAMYISAAIGTMFAYMFVPVIFLGLYELLVKKRFWRGSLTLSIGIAAVVLSHLITMVMLVPFIAVWILLWWLFKIRQFTVTDYARQVWHLALNAFIVIGLVSFYILPLIFYLPHVQSNSGGSGLKGLYVSGFPLFKQLLYSPWGAGPIISQAKDGEISMQVGIAQWIGVSLALVLIVLSWWTKRSQLPLRKVSQIFAILYGLVIVAMLEVSTPIWAFVDGMINVDYPFRLLLLAVCMGSLLSAWVISVLHIQPLRWAIALGLIVVALYTNRNHIRVNQYTDIPLQLYIDSETTTNTFSEYAPKDALINNLKEHAPLIYPTSPSSSFFVRNMDLTSEEASRATVLREEKDTTGFKMEVQIATPGAYVLHQFDFKGMQVSVDNQKVSHTTDQSKLMMINLDQGKHEIEVRFERLWFVQLGTSLTVLSLAILGYCGYRMRGEV